MALETRIDTLLPGTSPLPQRVDFFDAYRSYVINYNLGRDLVRAWVEERAGTDAAGRWEMFQVLLSSPMGPEQLMQAAD